VSNLRPKMRGLSRDQEVDNTKLARDIRTPMQQLHDVLADQPSLCGFLAFVLILPVFLSTTLFILVCVPLIYWITSKPLSQEQTLPLLLPREAGIKDPKDPKPGRHGYHTARGEFMLGNLRFGKRPEELWLGFAHLLTHSMILGATGSGKTETLVSMVANYIAVGSGVMYSDAKAAPKLAWQVYTLARYFGREEDFRTLNYIKGNTSLKPDPAVRRGNNVNLFTYGSSESITQIIISLMPPGGSENMLFSERAIGLITATMPGLVDLRDTVGLKITPGVIRKALEFAEVQLLKRAKSITPNSREALRAYLSSLPSYSEHPVDRNGRPTDKQPEEVTRQFGFAQAYFTRALASLSDTYGDIYMVGRGEINFLDIILRRRIGVVMIPALEKAPDEMKNLAKIVLAAQKNAISTGIPPDIEGRKEDVLDNLPTTAPVPFGIINDEFAFMMTPGYGTVLAQARGLFTAITIAGQDYAGMKREDADEAEQIAENTKLKIIMASEGLGATKELIQEIAGEGVASVASSYAMDESSMSGLYRDSKSANFEKRSRVDTRDTRAAVEGEGIVFWRDQIVPINMFYHGLDEDNIISDYSVHRMLDVGLPTRGYGATLLEVDPPIVGAMKNAVRKGQCLDVDKNYIPEQISTPLWAALPQFRSIVRKSPSLPIQDQEGILLASIMAHLDQKLFDAMDEDDPETDLPASDSHPHFDINVATSVQTLAPPEDSEATDSMAIEMFDMKSNIDETLIKMTKETDEQAYPQAPHTEAVSADDHQTDAERKRETASYAGSSLVASAPFLVDPVLLASRAGREITEREAIMYNEAANNVREMEEALGTSAEAARNVGISTAHAIAKAIDYPAGSSRPTMPTNEDEERLVLRDAGSVMEAWVAKTAASNPSRG
jgi:intracellular multiplication protein IcmO